MLSSASNPPSRLRVLLFPASLRKDSHQLRLIDYLARSLSHHYELDRLLPGEFDLPLFNQDLESREEIRRAMITIHDRFHRADAIIIASPEYNGSIAPYLKNTLDWVSRLPRVDPQYATINPFWGKPALLCSVTTGWSGGILGLQVGRSLLAYLGYLVMSEQISISDAGHWIRGETFEFEPSFAASIDRILLRFGELVHRLRPENTSSGGNHP